MSALLSFYLQQQNKVGEGVSPFHWAFNVYFIIIWEECCACWHSGWRSLPTSMLPKHGQVWTVFTAESFTTEKHKYTWKNPGAKPKRFFPLLLKAELNSRMKFQLWTHPQHNSAVFNGASPLLSRNVVRHCLWTLGEHGHCLNFQSAC